MKIGFLSHLDLNLYLFRLPIMVELIRRGFKVYAICPKGDKFDSFKDYNIEAIEYKIERSSLNPIKEIKHIYNIYSVIKTLDLDIIHTFTAKPNIYGTIASKILGVPRIFNLVEGLGSFYISNNLKSIIVRNIMEILYKFIFNLSNIVIFVNSDDPKYFIDKSLIKKSRVKIIKSVGIDTEEFKPLKIEYHRKKLRVLMIARAIWHKGIKEYYQLAQNLKNMNVEFILIGDTDEGNHSCANRDFLINGYVKWLGHRDDIKEQIDKCDIFVLPSYREGVPRTLLEAASMEKPIVTTNSVGCKEVVEDTINGFLVPIADSDMLTIRVQELLENKHLRDIMGKNSRIKVINEFDIHIVIKQYMELYEKTI